VQALLAGNDILLGSVDPKKEVESVKRAVESGVIPNSLLEEKVRKVLSYKYIHGSVSLQANRTKRYAKKYTPRQPSGRSEGFTREPSRCSRMKATSSL